jgi:ribosomal protein S18 acetylase RimI-like enzyme
MAHASDRDDVRAFLNRLSTETLRARYLGPVTNVVGPWADRETQRLLNIDQVHRVVVLAEAAAGIRGIGEFTIDASGHSADLALTVEDTFQGVGIGQALLRHLERLAQERGVLQFTGHVAYGNDRVVRLLRRAGRPLRFQIEYGALHFTLGLAS